MAETIFLTPKKTGIAAFREKKTLAGRAVKVLTSPKTTLALGATLGALLTGGALAPAATGAALRAAPSVAARSLGKVGKALVPKTAKGALTALVTVPTAVGLLSTSKTARKAVKTALDPRESIKRGKKIGEIIEDPSKTEDILGIKEKGTLKEKVLGGLKTAGKVGAVAGLVAGGVALTKKALEKRKEEKAAEQASQLGTTALGAAQPRPVGLGGVPIIQAQPLQSSPEITGTGAPQSTNGIRPIQNIIQIAVR